MTPRLDVELFEIVPVSAGTVLLRLEGRWHAEARAPLPMPTLVVDDGRRSRRVAQLPGPDAKAPQAGPDAGLWRASYPLPADLVEEPRVVFALDAGRGTIVDLPSPAPRGQGRRFSRSSGAELAHERTLRAQAEKLADERRRALRDAEAELDRERAARAAETMRADTAESDLGRVQAELESAQDHARADAAQQLRDAEAAASTLAVAQARVRELDEALAAQRRRGLEAQSTAQSTAAETEAHLAAERSRAADALAAQRALAEEATRAQIAAQTQATEHAARAADLERARDALREQLEQERETVRALQAKEVAEATIEERRRSRETQAAGETAERRVRELTAELVTLAEDRARLEGELAEARQRITALEQATPAADPAPVPAVAAVTPVADPVPAAAAQTAAHLDQATVAFSIPDAPPEEEQPGEPAPAPAAEVQPQEEAAPPPPEEPAVPPTEESSGSAVAVFGPFGDPGGTREHVATPYFDLTLDPDAAVAEQAVDVPAEAPAPAPQDEPSAPAEARPRETRFFDDLDDDPAWMHPPPRWDTDEFDMSFDLPAQQTASGRREARQHEVRSSLQPGRGGGEVQRQGGTSTRAAVLLGIILAATLLLGLKIVGVL